MILNSNTVRCANMESPHAHPKYLQKMVVFCILVPSLMRPSLHDLDNRTYGFSFES